MKPVACLFALAAFAALPAFAQSTSTTKPTFSPAPPPPGMNDPGVDPTPVASSPAPAKPMTSPAEPTPSSYPSKPIPMPRMPGQTKASDANLPPPPDIDVKQQGDNTVEEYRQNGRVYMVVVRPKHGIPQTYMVDPQGRLHAQNGAPPVQPVMYTILKWGKSKPAEASSSDGN
ncbi:DUF2782 domain-containing protein [Dyella sp. A6]|uniref:DUF2782 domain-containing protein n=1 Tax=Dyella aluminiiresistens TaxID=3069105 RepID=UPI002E7897DD|nr:DUF2782 domain-containing protein [Dyella sp. A6]